MKKFYQVPASLLLIALCSFHLYLFVSGISLGAQINTFESELKKLRVENIELEKKLYSVESLNFAASEAAKRKYTKKAVPLYLDNLSIAQNR